MSETLPANSELELKIPLDTDRTKADDSLNGAPSFFRTSKGEVMEYRNCVTDSDLEDTYCTIRLKTTQLGVVSRRAAIRVVFKITLHPAVPRQHRFRNAILHIALTPSGANSKIPEVTAFSPEIAFGSPHPRRKSLHQMAFNLVSETWTKDAPPKTPTSPIEKEHIAQKHEDHFSISGRGLGSPHVHEILWEMTEDRESEHGCMGLPRTMETAAVILYEGPFSMDFKISTDIGWEWGKRNWTPNCWPLVQKEVKRVEVDPEVMEKNEEEFDRFLMGGLIRHTSFGAEAKTVVVS